MSVGVQDVGMTFKEFVCRYFPDLTVAQQAKIAGVGRSTLSRWMKINRPTSGGAGRLARAAGVSVDVALGLAEPPDTVPFRHEVESIIERIGYERAYDRLVGAERAATDGTWLESRPSGESTTRSGAGRRDQSQA